MGIEEKLDLQVVLDGLGQGILIFDSDGKLLLDNLAARTLLATDITILRSEGWKAAAVLFNAGTSNVDGSVDAIRDRALHSERPVRFHIYRSGAYIPCWAAAVTSKSGGVYTMVTLETPDWAMVNDLVQRFRNELEKAVEDTSGHIQLIKKTLKNINPKDTAQDLARRVGSFTELIAVHMSRTNRLMEMFSRLEDIRLGSVREHIKADRKKIELEGFFEDLMEELDEIELLDPETEAQDVRSRISSNMGNDLAVTASKRYLTRILHDILRNAMMYSLRGTPVKISALPKGQNIQIDITDEGYGVRQKENESVFGLFTRARQPQIISEFGYGLSLYLCKQEIEAMNGRIWFTSEEGVGTTFSILLPVAREEIETSGSESKTS